MVYTKNPKYKLKIGSSGITVTALLSESVETASFIPHLSYWKACRKGDFIRKKAKEESVK